MASAVLGFSQMGIASVYGIVAGPLIGTSADAMAVAIALPTILGFVVLVLVLPAARRDVVTAA